MEAKTLKPRLSNRRGVEAEKEEDVRQENTDSPAMCVPTKQLKERNCERTQGVEERAAVTSNLLLAQIRSHSQDPFKELRV